MKVEVTVNLPRTEHTIECETDNLQTLLEELRTTYPTMTSVMLIVVM